MISVDAIFKRVLNRKVLPAAIAASLTCGYGLTMVQECNGDCETSLLGKTIIAETEGLENHIYLDVAGYPTICVGHRIMSEPEMLKFSKGASDAECYELMEKDLTRFENAVNNYVKVPICQAQFDALVSFSFNVGTGAFKNSTLLRLLNAADFDGAADEFRKWRKAGGRVVRGLENRRGIEKRAFELC